jgi:hypothetical protein
MNVTEFLAKARFTPYSSVLNSWDSFNEKGSVLMQLWAEPGQRVRGHSIPGAYLRVCCWNSVAHAKYGQNQTVGYNGRTKAINAIEGGAKGYAALSNAPEGERKPGAWARNADVSKVFPVIAIERPSGSKDIFAILGTPIQIEDIQ